MFRSSLRASTSGSRYPVCRTVRSVQRTATFARLSEGKICSCTRYAQRTPGRMGNSRT